MKTIRRLELLGETVLLDDDKAVTRHLAPLQPKWGERGARAKRIHLLSWVRNQGERSRMIMRGGYIVGRIDAVRVDAGK